MGRSLAAAAATLAAAGGVPTLASAAAPVAAGPVAATLAAAPVAAGPGVPTLASAAAPVAAGPVAATLAAAPVAAGSVVASLASAAAPVAAGPVVATLAAAVPIGAGGGWVVWSVPAARGWLLEGSYRGVTRMLAAAPRPQPFDLNVGTRAAGGPVVTFSRCARTPVRPAYGLGFLAPLTGAGCRVHVLDLSTGRESAPAIPHPVGTSDTTPSMWRGRVAFARLDPAHHGGVQQVLLWRPGRRGLVGLPHGAMPAPCAGGCAGQTRTGSVEGLAYDGRLVSFLWEPVAPGIFGQLAWEVRADFPATGATRILGAGVAGEVCTGGEDLSAPSPPVLDADTVRFASLQATCYVFRSVLSQVKATAAGNGVYGVLPGVVLGLAQDGPRLYALEAPAPADQTNPICTAAAPCLLEQIPPPAPLKPEPHKPASPFSP